MRHKHGAVVYRGNQIISTGFNITKTHPLANGYYKFPHTHAELSAVVRAHQDLTGCSIAVVRINKNDETRMSKPCKGCMQLLKDKGIKVIVYTEDENTIKKIYV